MTTDDKEKETQKIQPEDVDKAKGKGKIHGDPILVIE